MSSGVSFEERLKSRDLSAAEELYRYFFAPARDAAFRILRDRAMAEDVAQEALWRAWTSAASYDPERGTVLSWVCTIAHNISVDYVRSPVTRAAGDGSAVEYRLTLEERTAVIVALGRLHPLEKEVLILMFYDGLSHAEIARHLKRPLGTVKTRIRTALSHLREQIMPVPENPSQRASRSRKNRIGYANLKRSEALLKRALEHGNEAIAISDTNAVFVLYNNAANKLLGIAQAERDLSQSCTERYGLYRPDGQTPYPTPELPLLRAIDGEYIFRRSIFVRNHTSPNGILVDVSAKPRLDEQGRVIGGILKCIPRESQKPG